ncbi:MAG TPA: recombinase family protein [Streptosporangiaceae bacterium]|nr:recombinase family protein [Streptosporangiaceae bacterium]
MGTPTPPATHAAGDLTSTGPVPVAFTGRTSTLVMQDPAASLRRQVREVQAHLPAGWFIAAWYWDIESGGLDIEDRGHGTAHEQFPGIGIPRDGGLADLLAEARSPDPRFAVVMCEDIERSGRDTFNALKLEKELAAAGVPLFATDEPIDVEGINPTTILIRRVKQGVTEWFRLQIKKKAWQGGLFRTMIIKHRRRRRHWSDLDQLIVDDLVNNPQGLREHTLAGWNIGRPPYGYAPQRVPHPVPMKAAQERTKTRLVQDPVPAAAVAQIFTWRVQEKAGITTIARRLNADHDTYPPPKGDTWTDQGVYALLSNPKYTGHMVWNRYANTGRRDRRLNPPDQWVWSPEPAHPAIITRELWDAAQAVTASRDAIPGEPGEPAHPLARHSYELRSLIRHRTCKRRMCGITRTTGTYYLCPHDTRNPRHAAAAPDHPHTVTICEEHLYHAICQFFAERIFGPERAALLSELLPANAADDAARKDKQAAKLRRRLRQIDTAEEAHTSEIEALATTSGNPKALQGHARPPPRPLHRARSRTRHHHHRASHPDRPARPLDQPRTARRPAPAPALLPDMPRKLRRRLYQAFDLNLIYKHDTNQVTIRATITDSTPETVAAIIRDSRAPGDHPRPWQFRLPLCPYSDTNHLIIKPRGGMRGRCGVSSPW